MKFEFYTDLLKAEKTEDGLFLSGVASTTNTDRQHEAMSKAALESMVATTSIIPITTSHNAEATDTIGEVVSHQIDDEGRYVIKARLEESDPQAVKMWNLVNKGHKIGFSVGGNILASKPSMNKSVKRIIDKVSLDHICVTRRPVNTDTFAVALNKAFTAIDEEFAKSSLTQEDYSKYATYKTPDGKGHFPIRPGSERDAEAALHLIGHAPETEQPKIRKRACAILGPSHPACAPDAEKSEEIMSTKNTLSKAGRKLSADTMSALKDAHDSPDMETMKQKLSSLMAGEIMEDGDAADQDAVGPTPEAEKQGDGELLDGSEKPDMATSDATGLPKGAKGSNIEDGDSDDTDTSDANPVGLIHEKALTTEAMDLIKAEIKSLKSELAKSIIKELKEDLKSLKREPEKVQKSETPVWGNRNLDASASIAERIRQDFGG